MGLQLIDWICILGYLCLMVVIGSFFAKSQKTSKDYFLAGKTLRSIPLAISMYASIFSSNSYIMVPAEAFRHDMQYIIAIAMFPIASVFSIILFIDFYTRLNITTIYEYLEYRFNHLISLTTLSIYMIFRSIYAGVVIFTLSLVLHLTMGFPLRHTMLVIGLVAIVYTTLGGLKAVVWTDVLQFFIMFGGLLAALYFAVKGVPGGVDKIFEIANSAGRLRVIDTDFDLTSRYVIWTLIPYGLINFIGEKTVDQMNVQRYLSASSAREAKKAMLIQSCFSLPMWILLFTVGIAIFAYYTTNPSETITTFIENKSFDRIFPHYIFSVLPSGIRGIVIAALLAAAMSTLDSVLNVLSTISVVNLYSVLSGKTHSDIQNLKAAKIMTVFWGIIIISISMFMVNIKSIFVMINSVIGIMTGPVSGLFVLGMFFKRTNWQGSLLGMICGFTASMYLEYGTEVTFTLYGICGLFTTIACGILFSCFFKSDPPSAMLTWKWRGFKEMIIGQSKNNGRRVDIFEASSKS